MNARKHNCPYCGEELEKPDSSMLADKLQALSYAARCLLSRLRDDGIILPAEVDDVEEALGQRGVE